MGRGARLAAVVCALSACTVLQSGPDPDAPTPWLWAAHARAGASSIDEDLAPASDSPGSALGFQAFAAYQALPRLAAGLAIDATIGFHGDGRYPIFALAPLARSELPHLTLTGWAGWFVGNRLVDADSDDLAESGLQLMGPGAGVSALWRIEIRPARALEIGPWADALLLHSADDDPATPEDDEGAAVRALAAGLMAQFVFGGVR